MQNNLTKKGCSTVDMMQYSLGACAESLILNSFFGFAMLYYTKALGLSPQWAGWAAALATFWDAVTDPVMGHISDDDRLLFFHLVCSWCI
jgi:GPH family glycoside/pentoside/hexuronide:cation symporter